MKKVSLEITKIVEEAGYIKADNEKRIFTRNNVTTTTQATLDKNDIVYYTNDYNIFSKSDRNGNDCKYSFKIVDIKDNSIVLKANESALSYKTILNNKEVEVYKEFEVATGQAISMLVFAKDNDITYSIYVNSIISDLV